MTIAKGLLKQTIIGKQTGLGVPKTGAGGQILRRKTFTPNATRATSANDEISSSLQDSGITYGQKALAAKLSGNLSPLSYSMMLAGLIRKNFVATIPITGVSLTIAGTGPYTITRSAGSWLTDGIKIGDVGRLTAGAFNAANLNNNFFVYGVSATVLTGVMLNGTAMVAEGPVATASFTVIGKKAFAPTTGQTNDYFTFEDWYSDTGNSEVFPDCKINQAQIAIPASGSCTVDFDIVGLGIRTLANAQSFTTPSPETTTGVVEAVRGVLYVNGVKFDGATAAQLTIDSGIQAMGATIGSVVAGDLNQSRLKVSGTFTGQFLGSATQQLFDNETPISLILVAAVDGSNTADFMAFNLPRIKITGDAPDDGEKEIIRTYQFTAELNGAGGAALSTDQTIISIQDSAS